jgi:hypothetical protein
LSYLVAADLVVFLHLLFIAFAVAGGLAVRRRRGWIWAHVPALCWSALVALMGWRCPLTPLEQWLRVGVGGAAYQSSFIEHYLLPILYPPELSRPIQVALGLLVLAINAPIYAPLLRRSSRTNAGHKLSSREPRQREKRGTDPERAGS